MKNIVLYTVIIGDYDELRPPLVVNEGIDYICFTDMALPEVLPWQQRIVTTTIYKDDPRRLSRFFKIHGDIDFDTLAQYSLYHDGNIRLKIDPIEAVDRWLVIHDIAICSHSHRQCIYDEAEACLVGGLDYEPERIRAQMEKYRAEGYPENNGMGTTTVMLRRHTEKVRQFNEAWWDEVLNHSVRDQLSFDYIAWKLGMKYDVIPGDVFQHEYWDYLDHKGKRWREIHGLPLGHYG